MPTGKERGAYAINLPLQNSDRMKCIAVLVATTTAASQDLSALFADLEGGNFITLAADGGKVYVALGASSGTAISELTTSTGNAACWPLPDGKDIAGIPLGGREVASGYGVTNVFYKYLHYKVAAGGDTAYLRVYRSSTTNNNPGATFKRP